MSKTSINKNESELDKMKRESLEWIDRYGKTAPPFISVAINAFSQLPAVTDEDIAEWANSVDIVSALNSSFVSTEDDISPFEWAVFAAKAMRDGLIPASGNTVKEEENKVKFLINDVCKWEDSPGYDSLEKTLSDKYFVRFKNYISSTPNIKQGEKESLPYPNPISKHQTDINIGWMRAMKYMKNQPIKDITDEDLNSFLNYLRLREYNFLSPILNSQIIFDYKEWMRSKMKS